MFKIIRLVLVVILVIGCSEKKQSTIIIAAAANMQYAIAKITKSFTDKTGIECQLIIGSSGKITAQIKEGAPFDILLAANMKYPNDIYVSGLTSDTPKVYAYGQLVLWSLQDDAPLEMQKLNSTSIQYIAIANPKNAPYGAAAIQSLKHMGMYPILKDKLVYGESIAQTNQFIISGSAQAGFTAKSVVISPGIKNTGKWIPVPANSYNPIEQGIVLIDRNKEATKKAQQFYDFLFSSEAKEILEDFGYLVPE